MTRERWMRVALGYLAFAGLQIGGWALFAPESFYNGFPGFGRGWIAVDGPYNEHMTRDMGALQLALAFVFVAAAVRLDLTLVRIAAVAAMVWGVPHLIYHIFNIDGLTVADQIGIFGGLGFYVFLPVALLFMASEMEPARLTERT